MSKYFIEFSFFLFSFLFATDLVVLLITHKNDGILRKTHILQSYTYSFLKEYSREFEKNARVLPACM